MSDFLKGLTVGVKKIYGEIKFSYKKRYGNVIYSQCGEDKIIEYVFSLRGISRPSYIDIGANDPFFLNNTAIFYKKGARGLNIDANTSLVSRFNRLRSKDVNLNIGVGIAAAKMEFYIFKDDTLSTFSAQEAEVQRLAGNKIAKIETIQVKTLDQILKEYNNGVFPDLLSIDIEGIDFEVIRSTDFSKSRPKVICAETAEYSPIGAGPKRTDYIEFIEHLGYYLYADTNLNSIFVDRDFWFKWQKK
jgi:FkbM family methyltransferase